MFYDHYELLCKKANKKPYTVAKEIGLGSSNVAQWKKGSTPRPDVLQRLSEYFGVTQAELLGFSSENNKSPAPEGAELIPGYSDLSEEEKKKVSDYIDLLLAARQKE